MSKDIKNFITWIRSFLDDVYALKGQGGGITIDDVYPVGSIYMSANNVNPTTLFGGTWVQIKDQFLLSKGDTYTTLGATGGEAEHTLTVSEMPSHSHSTVWDIWNQGSDVSTSANRVTWSSHGSIKVNGVSNTGGDQNGNTVAHNNMPPYLVVNIWKRTA